MQPRRAVRYLGFGRNPLRRPADRVEAGMTMLLVVTFLIAGPVAAWRSGYAAYRSALHAARIAQHELVRVDAVLEEDAVLTYSGSESSALVQNPVRARWTGPDGTAHEVMIVPDSPAPAGTVVTVWTDVSGRVTEPPRAEGDIRQDGVRVGLLVLFSVLGLCGGAWMLVRRLVERRQMACWQGEWMLVEPRWTGRR